MLQIIRILWRYGRALGLLYLCVWAGNALAALLSIRFPGSIIGMLLLFVLLSVQILPADWVEPGCRLLIRYMALLFIPIGVGVMGYYTLLTQIFMPIVLSCVVSTFITLLAVAYSAHYFYRKPRQTPEEKA
ncbi:MAG: CidA/LrgA family protein [Enterobacteriaceae bacterium]